MVKFQLNMPVETKRNSHLLLVGPPIFLTMVFCFGMVAFQPHPTVRSTSRPIAQQSPRISVTDQPPVPTLETPSTQPLAQIPLIIQTPLPATSAANNTSSPQPAANTTIPLQSSKSVGNNLKLILQGLDVKRGR